jgi:glycosyltransferase involved in cell wall biosynthesis
LAAATTQRFEPDQIQTFRAHRQAARPKLAFLVSRFPKLSETFILHEVLALRKLGVDAEIYSLLRHQEGVVHDAAKELMPLVHFHPFFSLSILRNQWHFLRHNPSAYFKVLGEALRATWGSPNFFFGALCLFPKAVRMAHEMQVMGIGHVHAQFANHAAAVAFIIHGLTGIPFSFTARGTDIHVDRHMLKEKIEAAAFVVTVSAFNKRLMIRECGAQVADKIHVVYGGVDVNVLKPNSRRRPGGPLQILCVARFEEVKGHIHLVRACSILRDRGVAFECHLVGDGPLLPKIRKEIARAGLGNHIRLHGPCPQKKVVERLRATDILVLATVLTQSGECEGIPNVLKEAMACGLPVVGSNISGIPELVEHGRSGLLVEAGNPAALANALERLLSNPELRQRLGKAGREKVVREFNLSVSAARRARLFLSGGRAPRLAGDSTVNSHSDSEIT